MCDNCKPTLYRQRVDSLIYLTITRLIISYTVGIVSRFIHDSYKDHWKMEKKILKYIKSTINYGLYYSSCDMQIYLVIVILIMLMIL